MTEATVVETSYVPETLPPDLPDEACETDIATVPLVSEPHLPNWQPEIPDHYLRLSGDELRERIRAARAELGERLLILGHHYQRDDIIEFADFRGDSFKLAQQAAENSEAEFIVFCGVHFMAESADILTKPEQTVILPNLAAGCSMADMAQPEDVYDAWDDLGEVVDTDRVIPITYMNSAASLKAFVGKNGGAVCTSSNATAVLEWAFEQGDQVLFFPDQHLGRNTGKRLGIDPRTQTAVWSPRKVNGGLSEDRIRDSKILLWQGHCSVHIRFRVDQIERAREEHPGVRVVVHPECTQQVVDAADADGSTEFIINYVRNGPPGVYAVGTEINLVHRLNEEVASEGKTAFCLDPVVCPCATMYRIHPAYLAWVTESLVEGRVVNPITVDDDTRKWARVALDRMLAIT
ncbi:MAG: quinolinate synthase NadA [Chloroflexi bacterium]|nr:quinolinate synthase NadA [Chloroflexota bacterium]MCY3696741.1 quinolinate synthase NadA [Chloroflexota bacterium]MYB21520.1 quinolinate synthase NadA [Chloroflexota bacterium]MYF80963.1 quinolinate synthase NadA [Chloroflexota bacterium]MYI05689.1 quinolinate synthase NadA [Chloroflexota bacterium]